MRDAYGAALATLGDARQDVVALSADVANSDRSEMFATAYPDRFFNVGIAEQALVDVAAGLAFSGHVPFANTFAFLFATRALEMIRTHLCYGKANVKLMAAYAGLSDSFDGPTHHSITDLAIMRTLPNMTVLAPADSASIEALLPAIADWQGPVYCRLNRNEVPEVYESARDLRIGVSSRIRDGSDATIIACGIMVSRAIEAAGLLSSQGIEVRVLDMHTLKPLDVDAIRRAAHETGGIVTAEEHSWTGGLGAAVAEFTASDCPTIVRRVGLEDRFAETGPYDVVLDSCGLSASSIAQAVESVVTQSR